MIEQDQLEVAVPEWFARRHGGKYQDVPQFLDGTIAFVRSQENSD